MATVAPMLLASHTIRMPTKVTLSGPQHQRLARVAAGVEEPDELPADPVMNQICMQRTDAGARALLFTGEDWLPIARVGAVK